MAREAKVELKVGKKLRFPHKSKVGSRKAGGFGQSESKPFSRSDNGGKKSSNAGSSSRKMGGGGVESARKEIPKLGGTTRIRKRVYAEEDLDRESRGDSAVLNSKASRGRNLVKSNSLNLKTVKTNRKSVRSIWVSDKISRATKGKKPSPHAPRAAELDEREVGASASLKKNVKRKPTSSKPMERNQESPHLHRSKKTGPDNKKLAADSGVLDEQPKKKKRVIKIDPYDFSNKRLDDGAVVTEVSEEKKKESEKSNELSINAQFRAIQPSPSILSFVEENLLGRRRMIELRRAGYNTELSAPLDNIPSSTGSERERVEENVFRNKLEFFAAAKVSSSFPPPEGPEIAFAGRSNVGKSSLLNSLTRQWGVVRTSDKPGHTQTINFFKLGSKLRLVDLPGYGFAYAKDEVKEAWEDLVKEYVSTRVGLKRVCLLVDTKWGLKPRDRELIDLMERSQTKYQVVLTKTDIVFPIDVARRGMQIEESLKRNTSIVQPVMMVSSKSGAGIRSLRTVLAKIARFSKL